MAGCAQVRGDRACGGQPRAAVGWRRGGPGDPQICCGRAAWESAPPVLGRLGVGVPVFPGSRVGDRPSGRRDRKHLFPAGACASVLAGAERVAGRRDTGGTKAAFGTGGPGWGSPATSVNLSPPVSPCRTERDAFDTLFDHAPDKLNVVKKVGAWLLAARRAPCWEGGGEPGKSLQGSPHGWKRNYRRTIAPAPEVGSFLTQ